MSDQFPKKKDQKKRKSPLGDYAKYSTIGFQMLVIILGGILGGRYLDHLFQLRFPVITLLLAIVSVALAIYIAIKDFIRFK